MAHETKENHGRKRYPVKRGMQPAQGLRMVTNRAPGKDKHHARNIRGRDKNRARDKRAPQSKVHPDRLNQEHPANDDQPSHPVKEKVREIIVPRHRPIPGVTRRKTLQQAKGVHQATNGCLSPPTPPRPPSKRSRAISPKRRVGAGGHSEKNSEAGLVTPKPAPVNRAYSLPLRPRLILLFALAEQSPSRAG